MLTLSNQEQENSITNMLKQQQESKANHNISPPTPPLSSSSVSSLSSSPHSPPVKMSKNEKFKEENYENFKMESQDIAFNFRDYDKKFLGFPNGVFLNNPNFFAKKFFNPVSSNSPLTPHQYNFHLSQLQHEQNFFNNQYQHIQNQFQNHLNQSFNNQQALKYNNSNINSNNNNNNNNNSNSNMNMMSVKQQFDQKPQINNYNNVNNTKSEPNQSHNFNEIIPLMSNLRFFFQFNLKIKKKNELNGLCQIWFDF